MKELVLGLLKDLNDRYIRDSVTKGKNYYRLVEVKK